MGLGENSEYILVIEDHEATRQSIIEALECESIRAIGAADGAEAMKLLECSTKSPRVILLDMMMSKMNGWEFLDYKRGRPDFASIPVIVCSALNETARSVKPAAILAKPVQMKKLIDTVKQFFATCPT